MCIYKVQLELVYCELICVEILGSPVSHQAIVGSIMSEICYRFVIDCKKRRTSE